MSSAKGKILRFLSGVALKRGVIAGVTEIGGFQRLLVRCDVPKVSAGSKVQLLLPSDDVRTYSPIAAPDGVVLLGWTRAGGPGARWLSNARAGDALLFVGPQRSLSLDSGPAVIVGDETSVAVAAAFAAERPGQIHAVIQAGSASEVRAAAASVGLQQLDVVSRGDDASIAEIAAAKAASHGNAVVALTGGSELVIGVRDALRRASVAKLKTKTYWIPGRAGLD